MKIIFCILFTLISSPSFAQSYLELSNLSPYTAYQTFDTEHFHFIYQEGYFAFTEKAAAHFEHAHEILSPLLKWKPRGKTDILVADNEDSANGFTMPALRVGIVLIATPPDVWFSTSHTEDWIKLLVFHEYTHFLNIDPTTEWMEAVRIFFGDVIRPNGLWPVWMLEGLAVYYETRTSKLGRGRSPYYDSIIRADVNENRLSGDRNDAITLDRVNGDYPYFPSGEIPYLFGYHLWNQFSRDHGTQSDSESAMGELSIRSSARVPYFIEGNLENVMHKNWSDYWTQFVLESRERFNKQITAIHAQGASETKNLTNSGFSALGGTFSPNGQYLAYTESSMDELTSLVVIDQKTGKKTVLAQKMLGVGLSFSPDSRYLIYSSLQRIATYQLFSDLFVYDLVSGKSKALTEGLRAKDPNISFDGKHLVYQTVNQGTPELRIAEVSWSGTGPQLSNFTQLYTPEKFAILGTPRFIDSDTVIFSEQKLGSTQSNLITVKTSKPSAVNTILSDGEMNRYPLAEGKRIYYISHPHGIENVYSVTLDGQDRQMVTNVITGVHFPFFSSSHELHGSVMTSNGYEIASISPFHAQTNFIPVENQFEAPAPLADSLTEPSLKLNESNSKNYHPWSSLLPRQWAPLAYITSGTYSGTSFGGYLLGFDTTGKQQYTGGFAYHFKTFTFDANLDYTFSYFRPIITLSASQSTTDIASDVTHSQFRKSKEIMVNLAYPLLSTWSSLRPAVYGFVDWNQVFDLTSKTPIDNNGDFEYSNPLVPGFGASLQYSDAQKTKLGFISESGNSAKLVIEDHVNVDHFSVVKALASYQHFFGLGNFQVLVPKAKWLMSSETTGFDRSYAKLEGRSSTDALDEGTNASISYLGLRGYTDLPAYYRKSVGVASLDYHFPLTKTYRGAGSTTPIFIKQLHGFIFAESAYLPKGRSLAEVALPSFGGGVILDTTLLVRAPISFRLQVQNGTRRDLGGDTSYFLSVESASLY